MATEKEQQSKEVQLFFANYHQKRYEKGLKVSLIANEKTRPIFHGPIYTKFKNFHVRYVKHIVPSGVLIFDNNILIVSFIKQPVAFIITSEQVADSFRDFFYSMWKITKK